MDEGQILRFKIGDAFPADDQLARWMTVCAMALNDLLLVNRWLLPKLQAGAATEPGAIPYLGRIAAAHLFEVATFLGKSDRTLSVVREFVATLSDEAQANYRELLGIGDDGSGKFRGQLKHARNKSFHYDALLLGPNEDRERLKQAMTDHADYENEQDTARGRIDDLPPTIDGFRAVFAEDILVEMMLPKDPDDDDQFGPFLRNTSQHITKFAIFAKAALNSYVSTKPDGTWEIEGVQPPNDGTESA
jgi:hypothetical protein